ncbi:hypothetical protein GFH30_06285 [Acinetobacter wanghuae]|uniref:Uncharacterized protein n=1 Tax=Acinetobacter wanghuae TaxID=2662362 RepID=A0ABX6CZQ6_9GAMM|nr:hypothetical protein [Acinetobacter wanghuae]QGA11022.1 hypothetical protein GFH30_06285 [Acinetobacter wanghuae]
MITDLHDQFAMAAMQGMVSSMINQAQVDRLREFANKENMPLSKFIAIEAYKQADAMVAERERGGSESLHSIKQELIQRLIDEGIFTDKGFYQDLTVKRLLSILIDKELPF